jgi:hypothetical protein
MHRNRPSDRSLPCPFTMIIPSLLPQFLLLPNRTTRFLIIKNRRDGCQVDLYLHQTRLAYVRATKYSELLFIPTTRSVTAKLGRRITLPGQTSLCLSFMPDGRMSPAELESAETLEHLSINTQNWRGDKLGGQFDARDEHKEPPESRTQVPYRHTINAWWWFWRRSHM